MATAVAYVLLVLSCWTSLSLQAEVDTACSAPDSKDTQCYTVTFNRSIFEGHDTTIQPTSSSDTLFLLTIYSNTPQTDLIAGYDVFIGAPCSVENLAVKQRASTPPLNCAVTVTTCNQTEHMMFIKAGTKSDVFQSQVQIPKPTIPFQITIKPNFDEHTDTLQNSLGSSDGFTPTGLSSLELSGSQATKCNVTVVVVTDARVEEVKTIVIVIAVLLVVAAIAAKMYTECFPRLCGKKKGYDVMASTGTHMELKPHQPGHSGADIEEPAQKDEKTYLK